MYLHVVYMLFVQTGLDTPRWPSEAPQNENTIIKVKNITTAILGLKHIALCGKLGEKYKNFLTLRLATHTHPTNIKIITRKKGKCSFYWIFCAFFEVLDNFLYITHFLLIRFCFIAFSYSSVYC